MHQYIVGDLVEEWRDCWIGKGMVVYADDAKVLVRWEDVRRGGISHGLFNQGDQLYIRPYNTAIEEASAR